MKLTYVIAFILSFSLFADEAKKTKEEMKKELDTYVKENQEAAAGIQPIIDKVREVLSNKETPQGKKEETKTKPKP